MTDSDAFFGGADGVMLRNVSYGGFFCGLHNFFELGFCALNRFYKEAKAALSKAAIQGLKMLTIP